MSSRSPGHTRVLFCFIKGLILVLACAAQVGWRSAQSQTVAPARFMLPPEAVAATRAPHLSRSSAHQIFIPVALRPGPRRFVLGDTIAKIATAGGENWDGRDPRTLAPEQVLELCPADGLYLSYDPSRTTSFRIHVDAGESHVADAVQFAVLYETASASHLIVYDYWPTDDLEGWEMYGHEQGLQWSEGSLESMSGQKMSIRVFLWAAIGEHEIQVDLSRSTLTVPFY